MMDHSNKIPLLGVLYSLIYLFVYTSYVDSNVLVDQPSSGLINSPYPLGKNKLGLETKLKITEKDLNKSISFGRDVVDRMRRLETNLGWSEIHIKQGSTAQGQFVASNPESAALEHGKQALIITTATIQLMNSHCYKLHLSPTECAALLTKYNLRATQLSSTCPTSDNLCSKEEIASKYRSIDGSCNHAINKGQSFTSYKRLLVPNYLDGIHEPRRSFSKGQLLPSARIISTAFAKNKEVDDMLLTLAVMEWGQFISHDLAHTATSKMIYSGAKIECCTQNGLKLSPRYIHPFCAPVVVSPNDKVYSKTNLVCMNYVRSVPAIKSDCSLGPVDQLNQATHFLDGSQIYGNDKLQSIKLRSMIGGELKTSDFGNKHLLPISKDPLNYCQISTDDVNAGCFMSGDSRVNSQPQLATMHTLWLREHNRISKELQNLNPNWNDETLFQEARRIVIAEIQHITYNEWLPNILGTKDMQKLNNFNAYSSDIDPSISNSFATAAFRFIKSLMAGNLSLFKENRNVDVIIKLREYFNKPNIIQHPEFLDGLIRGLSTQTSQRADFEYVQDVSNFMYGNGSTGFDIVSLDIQRGRDHGIPSYATFRTLCGLPEVESIDQFSDVISPKAIKVLSQLYKHPNDVDLLVGGMLEKSEDNSLLGPTFSCIITDQFMRTQRGDRYFYTNQKQPEPFTIPQLNDIKNASLARIFCDNGDDIQLMQLNVFQKISYKNQLVSCNNIPMLDLQAWLQI